MKHREYILVDKDQWKFEPQNDHNFCSHSNSDDNDRRKYLRIHTGTQGPPGQGVLFGHLIVIKHVVTENGGNANASDFIIHVSGNHQSPDTFPGSETGTDVTLGFGSYQVTEEIPEIVGLGHLGVQYAAKMGFNTVAIGRGKDEEELVKLGARRYIDSR